MKTAALFLALCCVAPSAWATPACDGLVREVVLTGRWQRSVEDGITSLRRPETGEAVTAATYEFLQGAAAAQRLEVARRAVALYRDAERRRAGPPLQLSAVTQRRAGGDVQLCYSGVDSAERRRFVSVTRVAGRVLQHVYYEALGLDAAAFAQRSGAIFGRASAAAPRRPLDLPPLEPRSPRLPALPRPLGR